LGRLGTVRIVDRRLVVVDGIISQFHCASGPEAECEILPAYSNLCIALRACIHDFSSTTTIFGICSRNPATPIRDVLYVLQIYFVSKSLVLAETGRPAVFYDYAGPFFLVWFFPIGVWIVQPRINRLYERKLAEPSNEAGSRGRAERLRIGRSEIAYVDSATHQLRIAGTVARFLTNHLGGNPTRPRTR